MSIADAIRAAGATVGVLCGGPGPQRDISLASGESVRQALLAAGLDNEMIVVPEERPEECLESLDRDIAVVMLQGEFANGRAQEILSRRNIAYTGSGPEACALAGDKNAAKIRFHESGLRTPKWAICAGAAEAEIKVRRLGMWMPVYVKPRNRGGSVGITRIMGLGELPEAVETALALGKSVLLEERTLGRELSLCWLDGRMLPIAELFPANGFHDARAKRHPGETRVVCPAELSPEEEETVRDCAQKAVDCLGLRDLAKIDLKLDKFGPNLLEANALPAMEKHSLMPTAAAAAGISLERLCLELVGMAAARAGIARS